MKYWKRLSLEYYPVRCNARHMKNVPGKKTDMRASEWISTLLRAGLLNGSFIAEKRIREFRNFLGG